MSPAHTAVDACLAVQTSPVWSDRLCPECHSPYYRFGRGGGVRFEESGRVLCERCALAFILTDNCVMDLAEALHLEYVPGEEIDDE